jgi:hypothetical protein
MSNKYSFRLKSQDPSRNLPDKVVIGQQDTETVAHVVLKMFAFILFHRERITKCARNFGWNAGIAA